MLQETVTSKTLSKALLRTALWNHAHSWIVQCFRSPPTQYRLYGRRFLQVKRPNQQYQSTEGTNSTQTNQTYNNQRWTQNTASPLVYNNMGWVGTAPTEGGVARPERRWGCRGNPRCRQSVRRHGSVQWVTTDQCCNYLNSWLWPTYWPTDRFQLCSRELDWTNEIMGG